MHSVNAHPKSWVGLGGPGYFVLVGPRRAQSGLGPDAGWPLQQWYVVFAQVLTDQSCCMWSSSACINKNFDLLALLSDEYERLTPPQTPKPKQHTPTTPHKHPPKQPHTKNPPPTPTPNQKKTQTTTHPPNPPKPTPPHNPPTQPTTPHNTPHTPPTF
ncbi:hypothetical protein J6590_030854 [Homalodisca vitripennis]|nr:hypothetical protein J6590_030854 [Homalodisca vitripennis]